MRASILYRISSVLILLFAIGHTLGYRKTDPAWGVDQTLSILKRTTFHIQGFDRTYYGFYVGSGLFVTLMLLFTALIAWQLGRLSAAKRRGTALAHLGTCALLWRRPAP